MSNSRQPAKSDAALSRSKPPAVKAGLRVLVVDDAEMNRYMAIRLLRSIACIVDSASNGRDAVQAANREKYDVILIDCQMPGMDGYEAARIIRSQSSVAGAPLLIGLTAHVSLGEREKCLAVGMNDSLCKPLKADELFSRLEALSPQEAEPRISEQELMNTLFEELGGNAKLFEKMVRLFANESEQAMQAIEAAVAAADLQAAARAAHQLRGMAANFYAVRLQEMSGALEEAIRDGSVADPQEHVAQIAYELEAATLLLMQEAAIRIEG